MTHIQIFFKKSTQNFHLSKFFLKESRFMKQKFQVQDIISCYCEELGQEHDAQIQQINDSKAYIHFLHQDKRLDKWAYFDELNQPLQASNIPTDRVLTRHESALLEPLTDDEIDPHLPFELREFEKLHNQVTKIRNIEEVTISNFNIKAWYFSPYPQEFIDQLIDSHIYICDHCCQYFSSQEALDDHLSNGELVPPGKEIYRNGNLSVFELKGWEDHKLSCQCLCLLSKIFLDHKTLFYDVEGFIFYVLCECDEKGAHICAYFSREIGSSENILACIVVLPPYQKKGYGRLLIDLSYHLAKRSGTIGGPERPLSDLGKIAFHSYWRDTIVELFKNSSSRINCLEDIVRETSIALPDVIDTLKNLNSVTKIKGEYILSLNKDVIENTFNSLSKGKPKLHINSDNLIWLP